MSISLTKVLVVKVELSFDIYILHLGKSATIRESNHGSGVYKLYYLPKSSFLFPEMRMEN